jgi:hypothetical protein
LGGGDDDDACGAAAGDEVTDEGFELVLLWGVPTVTVK